MSHPLPKMFRVRQNFPTLPPLNLRATLDAEFGKVRPRLKPGARIAVAVGSRGITHLSAIVTAILDQLCAAGARPFILPAMGSHGGATPEGQAEVLAAYGITEATMNVPVHPSLEVRQIGTSADGVPVVCSVEALGADGVVLVNRVKPHTDFSGALGSGIVKMCVVGLGKRAGAAAMHAAASRIGHEQARQAGLDQAMLGQRGSGARASRLRQVVVGVETLAPQRDEQVAGLQAARVAVHPQQRRGGVADQGRAGQHGLGLGQGHQRGGLKEVWLCHFP